MNGIYIEELDADLLKKIDIIVEQQGYQDREQAIKAMLIEQAHKAVGVSTGGADLRNTLGILKKS